MIKLISLFLKIGFVGCNLGQLIFVLYSVILNHSYIVSINFHNIRIFREKKDYIHEEHLLNAS